MDFYPFFWGVFKYILPACFFIVAVWADPNPLLLIISIIWIMSSIVLSALSMQTNNRKV